MTLSNRFLLLFYLWVIVIITEVTLAVYGQYHFEHTHRELLRVHQFLIIIKPLEITGVL